MKVKIHEKAFERWEGRNNDNPKRDQAFGELLRKSPGEEIEVDIKHVRPLVIDEISDYFTTVYDQDGKPCVTF